MITSADAEWVPIAAVYDHVFALGRTPEAAKRDIIAQFQIGRLRHRVDRTVIYLPRPAPEPINYAVRPIRGALPDRDPKLGPIGHGASEHGGPQLAAMPPPSKVIGDQPLPREIFREGVEGLGCLDINWLNSNAIRRAGSTWQRYEFWGISCHRDSVLALWPVPMHGTTQPATAFTEETATEFVRRWLDNNRERPSLVKCEKDALATGKGGRDFIRVAFRSLAPKHGINPSKRGPKGPRK